jgi:hypothetical protein
VDANLLEASALSTLTTTIEIANVILDGNDIILTNDDEKVIKDDDGRSNEEKTFYFKVDNYRAVLKYPEKTMLSLNYYHKIIHALKHAKGGKSSGVDQKFHGWCKHHCVLKK